MQSFQKIVELYDINIKSKENKGSTVKGKLEL